MMLPLYCHPCLTSMGMEPNGSRYHDEHAKLHGVCRCCKEEGTVRNIHDYQRRRAIKKPKQIDRKRLEKRKPVTPPKPALREWPEGMRFDR